MRERRQTRRHVIFNPILHSTPVMFGADARTTLSRRTWSICHVQPSSCSQLGLGSGVETQKASPRSRLPQSATYHPRKKWDAQQKTVGRDDSVLLECKGLIFMNLSPAMVVRPQPAKLLEGIDVGSGRTEVREAEIGLVCVAAERASDREREHRTLVNTVQFHVDSTVERSKVPHQEEPVGDGAFMQLAAAVNNDQWCFFTNLAVHPKLERSVASQSGSHATLSLSQTSLAATCAVVSRPRVTEVGDPRT